MSSVSGPGGPTPPPSVNNAIEQAQEVVESLAQEASTTSNPGADKLAGYISDLQPSFEAMRGSLAGDHVRQLAGVSDKSLDKLSKTLATVLGTPEVARSIAQPTKTGNLGNILLLLGDMVTELQNRRKEVLIQKKKFRVERYEFIQMLNSTEKEFKRVVTLIKKKRAGDKLLDRLMKEISETMTQLKRYRNLKIHKKVTLVMDEKWKSRIIEIIDLMLYDSDYAAYIREVLNGEKTNGKDHVKLREVLYKFKEMVEEF